LKRPLIVYATKIASSYKVSIYSKPNWGDITD